MYNEIESFGKSLDQASIHERAWGIWKKRNNKHFRGFMPTHGAWRERFKKDFELLKCRNKESLEHFITQFAASV